MTEEGRRDPEWGWSEDEWAIICRGKTPYEFDFFARDLEGRLGMFASFNTGPVPSVVLESRARFNEQILAVNSLPVISAVVEEKRYGGEWVRYAGLGLYAYDNGHVHQPQQRVYERIAYPATPRVLDPDGGSLLHSLPMIPVRFVSSVVIPFERVPR